LELFSNNKILKRSTVSAIKNNSIELMHNDLAAKFIRNVSIMNLNTTHEYSARLNYFKSFILKKYQGPLQLDDLIKKIKDGNSDPYYILSEYAAYLQSHGISATTLKQRVTTIKNFFEYCDVDISPRKFKFKVKLPRTIIKNKEALSKEDIIDILNACSNIRLKTYVMFLAAGGFRAVEALSIRIKDLNLDANPARVFVKGEDTKTKTDRIVFLTTEMAHQLSSWLNYKYRTRRVCYRNQHRGKTITEYRTPKRNDNDLIFPVYQENSKPLMMYLDLVSSFAKTLDRIGKGNREDNNKVRQITLHSMRRFVKSTISDLGYAYYSEYFIGHAGSTYYRKTDKEKTEIFRKIEPYLTFLDFAGLERKGADTQTRIEELEATNQMLRQKDSMNTDAIAGLSDQLNKSNAGDRTIKES
jgi:integrase